MSSTTNETRDRLKAIDAKHVDNYDFIVRFIEECSKRDVIISAHALFPAPDNELRELPIHFHNHGRGIEYDENGQMMAESAVVLNYRMCTMIYAFINTLRGHLPHISGLTDMLKVVGGLYADTIIWIRTGKIPDRLIKQIAEAKLPCRD